MTDYQRFESIMALPFSPDERPSYLMNNMFSLMPDGYTPDFILKVFSCFAFLTKLGVFY